MENRVKSLQLAEARAEKKLGDAKRLVTQRMSALTAWKKSASKGPKPHFSATSKPLIDASPSSEKKQRQKCTPERPM